VRPLSRTAGKPWIPAFAGMTKWAKGGAGMTKWAEGGAGMTAAEVYA